MNRWFLSDTHFCHTNIIKYENRPFRDIEHMNEILIHNINERVKPEDEVYFLGDFVFYGGWEGGKWKAENILKRLNGKWIFVRGNHDKNNTLKVKTVRLVLELSGMKINCIHDPINSSAYYPINLVGHVHGLWKAQRYIEKDKESILINVAVENWDYRPVNWDEILSFYAKCKNGKLKLQQFDKQAILAYREEINRKRKQNVKKTNKKLS